MKYINDKYIEKKDVSEINFGRTGNEIVSKNEKAFAKIIVNNGAFLYYIRTYQGLPYDPLGPHSRRNIFNDTAFNKVDKNVFDFYIYYLSTNNSIYLTKTQRGILN